MPNGCTTQPTGASFETIIDIIPFGKLETTERTIAWPPDADVVMNVATFSDVFENSLRLQVRPDLIIPVASLPGLIVLKLFAWLDRPKLLVRMSLFLHTRPTSEMLLLSVFREDTSLRSTQSRRNRTPNR